MICTTKRKKICANASYWILLIFSTRKFLRLRLRIIPTLTADDFLTVTTFDSVVCWRLPTVDVFWTLPTIDVFLILPTIDVFFSIANYWCFLNIANCWCFVNTGNCCIISALSKAGKRQRRGFGGKDQQRIATTVKDWWNGDDDGILMMSRTRDRLWQQNKVTKYGVNHSWTNVQTCWSRLCSFIPFAVLIFGLLMLFC